MKTLKAYHRYQNKLKPENTKRIPLIILTKDIEVSDAFYNEYDDVSKKEVEPTRKK